ncbi:hypothetical protein G6F64_015301 [Rhizopus arrhizus]|uniref:Uncharacterized protein n=1 Tax=Rhizopus oryzae TaxID=64495 RepID=A0A9P7BIN6_RHIOR|nr:hypothetical protein G6F24_018043 [Rhizopus arrhizus]KAG1273658.1 hypothetical protein G6F64_015301 [Rhizopus arrhizus]
MPDREAITAGRARTGVAHGNAQVLAAGADAVVQAHIDVLASADHPGDRVVTQIQIDVGVAVFEGWQVDRDGVVIGDRKVKVEDVSGQQ